MTTSVFKEIQWRFALAWLSEKEAEAPLLLTSTNLAVLGAAALQLSQRLACSAAKKYACRKCRGCEQVERGTHPDVIVLKQGMLTIKNIRELIHAVSRTAFSGSHLIIVRDLETLKAAAGSALLKTLEDSPPSCRFILTTNRPRLVLPTIRSRCYQLALFSLLPQPKPAPTSTEDVHSIAELLSNRLRSEGVSLNLRRAFARLRDYYRVTAGSGNEKLAREVLVASLL